VYKDDEVGKKGTKRKRDNDKEPKQSKKQKTDSRKPATNGDDNPSMKPSEEKGKKKSALAMLYDDVCLCLIGGGAF
jgi:hypothetical protein